MDSRVADRVIATVEALLNHLSTNDPVAKSRFMNQAILALPRRASPGPTQAEATIGRLERRSDAVVLDSAAALAEDEASAVAHGLANIPGGHFRFEGAHVLRRGLLLHDGEVYAEGVQSMRPLLEFNGSPRELSALPVHSMDASTRRCVVEVPPQRHEQAAVLFNTRVATGNFGHFVLDFLWTLRAFEAVRDRDPLCLFTREFVYPAQRALFEWLFAREIREGRVRFGRIAGQYRAVYVPLMQIRRQRRAYGLRSALHVRDLAREFAARFDPGGQAAGGGEERIFVSRRDGAKINDQGRSRLDHDAIEKVARRCGYRILVVSGLAPEEVFRSFRNARVVAGVHGSGLLNILFSRHDDARLITLSTPDGTSKDIGDAAALVGFGTETLVPEEAGGRLVFPDLEARLRA